MNSFMVSVGEERVKVLFSRRGTNIVGATLLEDLAQMEKLRYVQVMMRVEDQRRDANVHYPQNPDYLVENHIGWYKTLQREWVREDGVKQREFVMVDMFENPDEKAEKSNPRGTMISTFFDKKKQLTVTDAQPSRTLRLLNSRHTKQ